MFVTKDEKFFLVDRQTGELHDVSKPPQQFGEYEQRAHRAKSFLYLHLYRKHAYSKSLRLCYVSSLRDAKSFHLQPAGTSIAGSSHRVFQAPPTSNLSISPDTSHTGGSAYVFKGLASQKAHFGGVTKCSSPWSCPVCSQRITTKRAKVVQELSDKHKAAGGFLYLLTLTVPHGSDNSHKTESLKDFVDDLTACYRALTQKKAFSLFKKDHLLGSIRALEVTYGDAHGWHPHLHILLFAHHALDPSLIRDFYLPHWKKGLTNLGYKISPSHDHVLVDVRGGQDAALYVAKFGDTTRSWGFSDEITKSHRKRAKVTKSGGRYSPFALLQSWADSLFQDSPNVHHLKLFQDFEKAFKGKNQLVVSRGLYAHYEVDQKSDAMLNTEFDEPSEQLASLSFEQWSVIVKNNFFSEVLTCAETGTLSAFLQNLPLLDLNPNFTLSQLFGFPEADTKRDQPISPDRYDFSAPFYTSREKNFEDAAQAQRDLEQARAKKFQEIRTETDDKKVSDLYEEYRSLFSRREKTIDDLFDKK